MAATICYTPRIAEPASWHASDPRASCPRGVDPADTSVHLFAKLARQALIAEVDLTPKPALVDRRGAGAHDDLCLEVMHRSALTLEPYFRKMAEASTDCVPTPWIFKQLRRIGRQAEEAMLSATNGSNTHKGAIWSLGLLIAAASMHESSNASSSRDASALAATAGHIASFHHNAAAAPETHGYVVQQRFAVPGARGEAQQAFPHVIGIGLPTLRRRRAQCADESVARLDCLLSIMSVLDDTCLLYRSGKPGLITAQRGARAVLEAGGAETQCGRRKLHALDQQLLQLRCSPGGSADLLAATLFLDALERGDHNIGCSTMNDGYEEA